jgi:hypothetical protein
MRDGGCRPWVVNGSVLANSPLQKPPLLADLIGGEIQEGADARRMPQIGMSEQPKACGKSWLRRCKTDERGPDIADKARKMADAKPRFDGFGQSEHGIQPVADILFGDMLPHEFDRFQCSQIIAERYPIASVKLCGVMDGSRFREIGRAPIKRPGDGRDPAANKSLGRGVGCANRNIGISL